MRIRCVRERERERKLRAIKHVCVLVARRDRYAVRFEYWIETRVTKLTKPHPPRERRERERERDTETEGEQIKEL